MGITNNNNHRLHQNTAQEDLMDQQAMEEIRRLQEELGEQVIEDSPFGAKKPQQSSYQPTNQFQSTNAFSNQNMGYQPSQFQGTSMGNTMEKNPMDELFSNIDDPYGKPKEDNFGFGSGSRMPQQQQRTAAFTDSDNFMVEDNINEFGISSNTRQRSSMRRPLSSDDDNAKQQAPYRQHQNQRNPSFGNDFIRNDSEQNKIDDEIPVMNVGRSRRSRQLSQKGSDDEKKLSHGDSDKKDNFGAYGSQKDVDSQQSEIENYTPSASRRNTRKMGGSKPNSQPKIQTSNALGKPPRVEKIETQKTGTFNFGENEKNPGDNFKSDLSDKSLIQKEIEILDQQAKQPIENSISIDKHQSIIEQKDQELKKKEETHTSVIKEKDQEFQKQIQSVRDQYDRQIKALTENYEKQLEHERDSRNEMMKDMNNMIAKEKDRVREVYDNEMKLKDQLHQNDKEALRRNFQIETRALQSQLEQQTQMVQLAEELRLNSDKLNSITNQLKVKDENQDDNQILSEKEKKLHKLEISLQQEKIFLQDEKKRIERMKEEVQNEQIELHKDIEKEKRIIQNEYARIQDLQNSLKTQEHKGQREVILEKFNLEQARQVLEQEKLQIKEEYQQKFKQFETYVEVFETKKFELQKKNQEIEGFFNQKLDEIQDLRKGVQEKEMNQIRKIKLLEMKEHEIREDKDQVRKEQEKVFIQRQTLNLESEKLKVIQKKLDNDTSNIQDIQSNFETQMKELKDQEIKLLETKNQIISHEHSLKHEQQTLQQQRDTFIEQRNTHLKRVLSEQQTQIQNNINDKMSFYRMNGGESQQNLDQQKTQSNIKFYNYGSPKKNVEKFNFVDYMNSLNKYTNRKTSDYVNNEMQQMKQFQYRNMIK